MTNPARAPEDMLDTDNRLVLTAHHARIGYMPDAGGGGLRQVIYLDLSGDPCISGTVITGKVMALRTAVTVPAALALIRALSDGVRLMDPDTT